MVTFLNIYYHFLNISHKSCKNILLAYIVTKYFKRFLKPHDKMPRKSSARVPVRGRDIAHKIAYHITLLLKREMREKREKIGNSNHKS